MTSKKSLGIRDIAVLSLLVAVMYGSKMAMAGLPNVEPVSLLVMVYVTVLGWKALLPIYAYVLLEIFTWGFGYWSACYLYVWLVLAAAAWLLRRMESPLGWAVLSGDSIRRSSQAAAASASLYGAHSYILLTWHGQMSDVFTLAHELGHAGHFKACNAAQSIWGTDVSTYFVEAPSTMNELLLAHYMLKTNPDKRFRRWVLSNMIGNTYYHNFVTHLLEAAYQREVYKIADAGGSLQAATLDRLMGETLGKFWGDSMELTEGAELTWMRQPHYYMGLYSYTYSAGLTVATQVCKRIEEEGAPAVEDWKRVLAAGGTKAPLELAKMAGVDISTGAPLLDTIETIGGYIDEICKLTEEIG